MCIKQLKGKLMNLGYSKEDLEDLDKEDLEVLYDNITDTSDFHPNESYEEFMEHEDF